ncbi:hypothetical protein DL240_01715 [Lujinxingia litoralis]|uniref:Polyprenyl synthetase family protein n=1 Tax=Lujinxingia litoralis TaxID=2211119 RepID=A0A328CA05_9DELT|nr:polyprenyl synthetase family protein [Lujinxingia litoralis]RAL24952.1 hypothetical protein DL240_01715 [Lujinxingia litoralis]
MTTIEQAFRELTQSYMSQVLTSMDQAVEAAGLGESSLKAMLGYHLETGGKRLRAILPLAVAQSLGVAPEALVGFGAACELIHNATLVHDDLQDGDEVRRGKPTIWKKFGAPQAINLGDAMLYLAPICLEQTRASVDGRQRVLARIFRDVLKVIDGQEREFALQEGSVHDIDPQAYRQMVRGKTSGLFALPMAGAAELCDAPAEVVQALEVAAGHLGVLFQIQDDILDLYGEKGRATFGSDLREGKISALVVAFWQLADAENRRRLMALLQADRQATPDDEVRWAIEAFREQGALAECLADIDRLRGQALASEAFSAYPDLRRLIEGMAQIFLEPIRDIMEVQA